MNSAGPQATMPVTQRPDGDRARPGPNEVRLGVEQASYAYAAAGRFPEAIAAVENTRALALASGQTNLVTAADARLAMYRRGQAFHQ